MHSIVYNIPTQRACRNAIPCTGISSNNIYACPYHFYIKYLLYAVVCIGMAYLHGRDKPLIHRDLGSKNVLLTKEGVVKIADFGQSKLLQNRTDSLKTTQPGTIAYMPPEAMKKGGEYTAKVDSFSLGVLMLEICTQSLPSSGFEGITREIEVIRHEEDLSLLEDAHPLKPLIVWCLQHEKLRPAVAAIHSHVKNVCETSKVH